MKKTMFIMTVFAAFIAAAETKTIDILPGEYWWGGTVGDGWHMPLGAKSDYTKDLRVDSDGNQAAPLLLSTKGRWVWCEEAFKYTLKGGKLTVETGPCPRRSGATPHPMDVVAAEAKKKGEAAAFTNPTAADIPNLEKTCYSKKTWAPIQFGQEKGGSLRAAFEHCSKTFFPPKGTPRIEFFEQPILNTWVELNYNQNEEAVLNYARSFLDNGMKPGVLMIDCFWQTDAFGPWVFHAARFKDPKDLSKHLHEMGYKLMLWHAPFVTMDSMPYRMLRDTGGILVDAKLKPYNKGYQGLPIQWWDGYSAVYDPTSPAGRKWYKGVLDRLMNDYGVDGFFFDGGGPHEFPPGDYIAYDREAQPTDLCRAFQSMGLEVPFQQLREAWKLGGEPMMNTLRDKQPKWPEMRRCITDMLAAGQLGYPFVVADLVGGGTCGNNGDGIHGLDWQDELFIRHLQIQCLSPMIQFSGSPWRVLSPGAQAIVKKMLVLRERFAPRITALATECGRTGIPMLRSMDFQFPGKGYELVLDQFMMGDDLLVAPIVEGGVKTRDVMIPEGNWRADDGSVVTGPVKISVKTPLERLPYFERVAAAPATARMAVVQDAVPDKYRAPALADVKLKGYTAEKMNRFLYGRVKSEFAKKEIFGEAREAIRKKEDDKTGLVGYWQGEFWGKLMMSAARVAQYDGGDAALRDFVREECHRLMAYEDADGCITSYKNREFVRGADGENLEKVKKMFNGWACQYCWNIWSRKYTTWGMYCAYLTTGDRATFDCALRNMDQLIDMMHTLKMPLWQSGDLEYHGLPSMSILKPLMQFYRETGNRKFLDYAREMLPDLERADGACPNLVANAFGDKLVHEWYPDDKKWAKVYEMTSLLDGFLEYYRITGEKKYLDAVLHMHGKFVEGELNALGSIGYNDRFRHSAARCNALTEPCDVVHWMRLNHDLFLITGDDTYMDYIELAYYNAFQGSILRDGSWGARATRSHARNWVDLEGQCGMKYQHCCIDNMPRGYMDFAQSVVSANKDGNLKINICADSTTRIAGATVEISGNYPVGNKVTVVVTAAKQPKVSFRKPMWCPKMDVAEKGDGVYEVTFEMNPRVVNRDVPDEKFEPNDVLVSQFTTYLKEKDMIPLVRTTPAAQIMYGPLVLAKSKRAGTPGAEVMTDFTVNRKGYSVTLEPLANTQVWAAWKAVLTKDGEKREMAVCDFGSAADTCTPYATDEYSVWF
jgi:DUF1680 family protein